MSQLKQNPAELRAMFGANLRALSSGYLSISDLSRQLGINRTQFNRYLAGESFPRPDILARICDFFKVDARILLEPFDQIGASNDPITHPFLRDYLGKGAIDVQKTIFPDGFYRFSRRSFINPALYVVAVVHVHRAGSNTYMRGYESVEAMQLQGLPTDGKSREFRGVVLRQDDGIAILVSRENTLTCSFNYLSSAASFKNNFWVGYVTRTVPESMGGLRATRLVYEHLGSDYKQVLPIARKTGFCSVETLLPFHRRLLQPDVPFQ